MELVLILAVVMIIFGVGRLPEVFGSFGRGIREFRKAASGEEEPPAPSPSAAERAPVPASSSATTSTPASPSASASATPPAGTTSATSEGPKA
jgi:sec-independent protein translocase protein TatA